MKVPISFAAHARDKMMLQVLKLGNCLKLLLNYLKLNCVNKSNKMK